MVIYWVDALIQYATNFVSYFFNIPLLSFANQTITMGETLLYFALAAILIRFIFNRGGSMEWFRKE